MPATARVLIVDDSPTMRALFSDALERNREVAVVGLAASADEARTRIAELRPNVLTLDVEMPGMNGLEFLEELMETRPMPVVMLSTLTQKGAATSLKAYELGAVECFPKPMRTTPDEFSKIADKLGKLVLAAAKSNVTAPRKAAVANGQGGVFDWNGRAVAISVSTGGVDALATVLAAFPANCPPTIVVMPLDVEMVRALATKWSTSVAPDVVMAVDGQKLEQGKVYLASDPAFHVVIDRWPGGSLRFIDRDPVDGARPAASLLFASLARAGPGVGVVMSGMGQDGARGLKAMRDAGAPTFAQDAESAVVHEACAAALALGAVESALPPEALGPAILTVCRKEAA